MRRLRSRRLQFGLAAPLLRLEVQRVAQFAQAGDLRALATALMREHYDPAYRRASAGARDLGEITMDGGAESDLDRAAEAVAVRAAAL